MIGCCPECGCEDDVYLIGEVKLQLTKDVIEQARFDTEDVYILKSLGEYQSPRYCGGKFRCDNCGHIFNEPNWK